MCRYIQNYLSKIGHFMKQLIQNTRYLLGSIVIQLNYKYNEMAKLIFYDGPVLECIPNSQHKQV